MWWSKSTKNGYTSTVTHFLPVCLYCSYALKRPVAEKKTSQVPWFLSFSRMMECEAWDRFFLVVTKTSRILQALPGMEPWSDVRPPNISKMGPEDAWRFVDCPLFSREKIVISFFGWCSTSSKWAFDGDSTWWLLVDYLWCVSSCLAVEMCFYSIAGYRLGPA